MKLIVCSTQDVASMNICNTLLTLNDFDTRKTGEYTFHLSEEISIVEIGERLIYADHLDLKLSKYIEFEELLFASRHSSKDGRKIFTVHATGNVASADYGGKPYSLAKPSPLTMKNYVLAMKEKIERKPEFEFTMEVTHHGPSEISKPSAFYEIGSTENEWKDEEAALLVAECLLDAVRDRRKDWQIAVGVGGTHYAPRQTEIMLETTFTFGHNFAKYTFEGLNRDILIRAVRLSGADYIVYDEKSVVSSVKQLLADVSSDLEIELLKTKEVKRNFKLSDNMKK
jgi:D-aminoacyl-tRNA deacylase